MKKRTARLIPLLLLAGSIVSGCATGRQLQAVDLPALNGHWEGHWQEGGQQAPLTLEISAVTPTSATGSQTWFKTFSGDMTTTFSGRFENGKLIHDWGGGAHVTFDRYNPETRELWGATRGRRGGEGTVYLKKQAR